MARIGKSGATRPQVDRAAILRMQQLRDQGLTARVIGIRFGVRQSTVYKHTKSAQ